MSKRPAAFLDTSVLIVAHDSSRPGHAESHRLLVTATRANCACAAYSLAEFYSVLSRLPGGSRLRPDLAGAFVKQIVSRVDIVALTAQEYVEAIQSAAQSNVAGGTLYDALLLACARKVNAEHIYTWNVRHFQLVAPDLKERIRTP